MIILRMCCTFFKHACLKNWITTLILLFVTYSSCIFIPGFNQIWRCWYTNVEFHLSDTWPCTKSNAKRRSFDIGTIKDIRKINAHISQKYSVFFSTSCPNVTLYGKNFAKKVTSHILKLYHIDSVYSTNISPKCT